jgi:hypothetical protein
MSEEFRALIEAQKPIMKRLKIQGFDIGPVTGNVTNPPQRTLRVPYDGVGVYVLQGIVLNSFPNSNWSIGTSMRPGIAMASVVDMQDTVLVPESEFVPGINNFLHWAYDNLDSCVNLAPQEFLKINCRFIQAGSRWVAGALIGTEYLFA